MGGLFKKGYTSVREEKERQDVIRENAGKRIFRFFLQKDGDEATIRFLTEEPITFYEHMIQRGGKYDSIICVGEDCPHCADSDRPSFKGAYLIYDKRPYEYTDRNGKPQSGEGQLRLYVQGTRVLSQLDRLSSRYGLTGRDYIVSRSGQGTSTSYMFERDKEYKLSVEEIRDMLPEKLRSAYNGTISSLEAIVQEQLEMSMPGYEPTDREDDEDTGADTLVSVDDDEEEEEEQPKRSIRPRPLGVKRKAENSVKPTAKSLFRPAE